jgi:hypothetical protein
MEKRAPLTPTEKERIYTGKLNGETLVEIARELHCSWETARKWWKRGREQGRAGLRQERRGRGRKGILAQFAPAVAEKAERLKRQHPHWGAARVRIELANDPMLVQEALPGRSRLATFFKERCPECVLVYKARPPLKRAGPKARMVHEEWQMDSQEGIELGNGETAIVTNIRDPVGAAPIASLAFSGKVTTRSRKLTFPEYRQVLRAGFAEFRTLPDRVSTDNELRFLGNPASDFPGRLTLYLVGLGIQHVFIRPGHPTDHAQVERGHRTFDNLVFSEEDLQDLPHLQQALDRERQVYLHSFPSQASDCHGQPPLSAHPELLHPRRFYSPALEPLLFSIQRVFDFLATFTFERIVSHSGCVALAHQVSIGRQYARDLPLRKVWVRCDPVAKQWVFFCKQAVDKQDLVELLRRPILDLNFETLTGLDCSTPLPAFPVQLPLPFPVS